MDTSLPKRKHSRLKEYDYSTPGAYFVTICTYNRRCLLSSIVGRGLAPAEIRYTRWGRIALEELLKLEKRYSSLKVEQYVIMPNHIHAILMIGDWEGKTRPPTIMDMVCAYKSLTVRSCRKAGFSGSLFQTSFFEHIIRGDKDYSEIAQYILNNPKQWELDKLYVQEQDPISQHVP